MASYLPGFFQTTQMPKRFIQYALSQLEIFETDTLDLENLDIAWGRKSTFDFRDVGLRVKKLETLVHLPPTFELTKARIALLRLTVPVDIFNSPVIVEVEDVQCQTRILPQSGKTAGRSTTHTNHDRMRKRTRSAGGRHTGHHSERRGSSEDDSQPGIPSAVDLAQSFLQTEPEQEKAELEAAIHSETREVSASMMSSDDGDIELPVGTGAPISLPGFMARYLQGIVDRIQMKIHNVAIGADVDITNEHSSSIRNSVDSIITGQLTIEDINIEGVTHEVAEVTLEGNSRQKFIHKEGKRLITLVNIRGSLISEASLFSSLSQSSGVSSPSATHSDGFESQRGPSKSRTSIRESSLRSFDGASSPELHSSVSSRRLSTSLPKHPEFASSMHASAITNNSGRFDDAPEDEDMSQLSESIRADLAGGIEESIYDNSIYLNQVMESQLLEKTEDEEERPSSSIYASSMGTSSNFRSTFSQPEHSHIHSESQDNLSTSSHIAQSNQRRHQLLQSAALPTRQYSGPSSERASRSYPLPSHETPRDSSFSQLSRTESALDDIEDNSDDDESTPMGEDNLTESQLFSHEDAESMYMSAMSHDSTLAGIPGGWVPSSEESEGRTSAPISPNVLEAREPLDNLEHARHEAQEQHHPELHDRPITPASNPMVASRIKTSTKLTTSSQQIKPMEKTLSDLSEQSSASSEEYSRVRKQVFSLDQVAIYIPATAHQSPSDVAEDSMVNEMLSSTLDGQSDPSRSTSVNVPGAFSTHFPSQNPRRLAAVPPLAEPIKQSKPADDTVEIAIGDLSTQIDISVGKLIWKLVSKLHEALKERSPSPQAPATESNSVAPDFKLSVEKITAKFLERLEGMTGSNAISQESWANPSEANILLQASLKGLNVDSNISQAMKTTKITLNKFMFGYARENILSFDAGLQMRASTRDLAATAGVDLAMTMFQTKNTTRCEILTLPIHVSIDLQRLDETFSWFGGLSSVLNLGSSIASNATITTAPPIPKARGVRFDTPIKPDDKSLMAQNKINIRVGGLILGLIGTECSVGVETSAVKIVSRDEGIGVTVGRIRLAGPHIRKYSDDDPAIRIDITDIAIDYRPTPQDVDLDRLLSLITPSKAKYDQDDDILLDTLLRQRKQGGVLRLTISDLKTRVDRLDELSYLPELGEEVSRLATVAKYLPDDDRPGLLSLIVIHKLDANVGIEGFGTVQLALKDVEIAQITLPALVALSIDSISVHRDRFEELIGPATGPELRQLALRSPAIMARMIGDEMEPIVKIKLWNLKVEYRVPTLVALLGLAENATTHDISAGLAASFSTLTDLTRPTLLQQESKETIRARKSRSSSTKPTIIDVALRDCVVGLNPLVLPSKILLVLTEAHVITELPRDKNKSATAEVHRASVLVIDDIANLKVDEMVVRPKRQSFNNGSDQVADLCAKGFVSVSYISSAKATIEITTGESGELSIDVELRDDLFVLESCADSSQTLLAALNGLTPPTAPSTETKYRTEVIPVQDLLASLSGDAFGTAEGEYNFDDDFGGVENIDDESGELDIDSHFYQEDSEGVYKEAIFDESEDGSIASLHLTIKDTRDGVLLDSFAEQPEEQSSSPIDIQENHFGSRSVLEETAHRWNSTKNTYDRSNEIKIRSSPLKVRVRDVHIIWNLFDGYDWQRTRDTITKAVQDVESKAIEKRSRNERRSTFDQDLEDDETVIGDFLFNSIYIGIPSNKDPGALAAAINAELNDTATETESLAPTTVSSSLSRQGSNRRAKSKKLRLNRSKHHKITFELTRVDVDFVAFPPGSGETQSSVDIRVRDFEIFDHVPTSTWKMFATYMKDAGERETGTSMIHVKMHNVKPIPELAASELVLEVTVLPLRLHVDQDALDFITRFFEFKDDSGPSRNSPGDAPFIQRIRVKAIPVKLDFKPKRVDYAGLRSGHTTEFMNFLILDEADMVLRHTIIYGISGFDKLGKCLNDIWMPDIKKNQLPGILAGLAPVRSLVNVGGGLRQLVVVPIHEYKKDGRIVRGISKGAAAFAKTTGTELVKLGAKVAIGVQTVLQSAEDFLGPSVESPKTRMEEDDSEEETKQISLYANQPIGVFQGLRGGYAGLQRDLMLARDAIIAVPGEVMEGGSAAGALRAVRRHAPTVILRPAIGVAKAGGQILMGATNSLDPTNLQRVESKYKKH
ncbi:hypothetical protein B7494_g6997 [Chlorociboria aeruginascens]|nr:hypothetical protein B7494_g6997 [Chlorociboria aeruginascens]